jgi:hypothetical protein
MKGGSEFRALVQHDLDLQYHLGPFLLRTQHARIRRRSPALPNLFGPSAARPKAADAGEPRPKTRLRRHGLFGVD